jgi:hypothetical protein
MATKLDPIEKKRRQDARDHARLAKFTGGYEFPRGAHVERFAFEMYGKGLLERENRVYSVSAGAQSAEYRWAYRLSVAGRKLVKGKG